MIDREIDDSVRGSPLWRHNEELMVSVPGVSPRISRTLMAELPELGTLDRRQVAALVGYAPFTKRSGRWQGKEAIAGGRAIPLADLFMGAMVAVRDNSVLKAFYERLVATGKHKMVALIALARKLVTVLNAIMRDQKPWQNA